MLRCMYSTPSDQTSAGIKTGRHQMQAPLQHYQCGDRSEQSARVVYSVYRSSTVEFLMPCEILEDSKPATWRGFLARHLASTRRSLP